MILYYSNYCEKCKEILPILAQCQAKKDIHFVSIDNRIKKEDNCIYIILENQKELILPPNITKVPALLLLNRGSQVLFGKQILEHIQPRQMATSNRESFIPQEPMAFSLNDINNFGVMSDNYSFLDQSMNIIPIEETELYKKDTLGLKYLNDIKKIYSLLIYDKI